MAVQGKIRHELLKQPLCGAACPFPHSEDVPWIPTPAVALSSASRLAAL